MSESVSVFAPGSIGNVGPGLDILGMAISGRGDKVTVAPAPGDQILIVDAGHPALPTDPEANTAAIAAAAVRDRAGSRIGLSLSISKGLPLSGGQGGSAASAVASAVATNILLDAGLDNNMLLECSLIAEASVAGRHLDNLAPSLMGGLVLVRSVDPIDVVRLPSPAVRVILVHPNQEMRTRDARDVLPNEVSRELALRQAANIAAMVAAAYGRDLELLGRATDDQIAEPARAGSLVGFADAKNAALKAGALGCSISGAGPTVFALARLEDNSDGIAAAMVAAYASKGMDATALVTRIDEWGAHKI